jgi:hypothetical protein
MMQGAKTNNNTYDYESFLTKLIHFLLEEGRNKDA